MAVAHSLYTPFEPPTPDTLLDSNALVLYFPGPRSVTGEDVLELHVHGGLATVKAVLAAVPRCGTPTAPIRYAEAGEFTRRAFMNDRLSLTQVEALGDTLSATTEQQRRLSVRGTTNHLTQRYEAWRMQLLFARGELEALIDFSEDQHFDESPATLTASVAQQVQKLKTALDAHSKNAVRGELLRNGISIGLLGAPNAGKSSLLNRIVGREAAIVSQEAGTTRDVVEVGIDLAGYLCKLGDTAGLRKAGHSVASNANAGMPSLIGDIELEGMKRAKARAAESDVVVAVFSVEARQRHNSSAATHSDATTCELMLDPEVVSTVRPLVEERNNVVVVVNKIDNMPKDCTQSNMVSQVQQALPGISPSSIYFISCKTAHSNDPTFTTSDPGHIQAFLFGLTSKFKELTAPIIPTSDELDDVVGSDADMSIWQESLGATERHRLLLEECQTCLADFLEQVNGLRLEDTRGNEEVDIVLAAEALRGAAGCLAKITGKGEAGDVEEVLGVVFEKFCVGK